MSNEDQDVASSVAAAASSEEHGATSSNQEVVSSHQTDQSPIVLAPEERSVSMSERETCVRDTLESAEELKANFRKALANVEDSVRRNQTILGRAARGFDELQTWQQVLLGVPAGAIVAVGGPSLATGASVILAVYIAAGFMLKELQTENKQKVAEVTAQLKLVEDMVLGFVKMLADTVKSLTKLVDQLTEQNVIYKDNLETMSEELDTLNENILGLESTLKGAVENEKNLSAEIDKMVEQGVKDKELQARREKELETLTKVIKEMEAGLEKARRREDELIKDMEIQLQQGKTVVGMLQAAHYEIVNHIDVEEDTKQVLLDKLDDIAAGKKELVCATDEVRKAEAELWRMKEQFRLMTEQLVQAEQKYEQHLEQATLLRVEQSNFYSEQMKAQAAQAMEYRIAVEERDRQLAAQGAQLAVQGAQIEQLLRIQQPAIEERQSPDTDLSKVDPQKIEAALCSSDKGKASKLGIFTATGKSDDDKILVLVNGKVAGM